MTRPLAGLSSADATVALGAGAGVALGYLLTASFTDDPLVLLNSRIATALVIATFCAAVVVSLSLVLGSVAGGKHADGE